MKHQSLLCMHDPSDKQNPVDGKKVTLFFEAHRLKELVIGKHRDKLSPLNDVDEFEINNFVNKRDVHRKSLLPSQLCRLLMLQVLVRFSV